MRRRRTPRVCSISCASAVLRDHGGETRSLEAFINTGFTDHLTLPPDIVEELGLPLRGAAEVTLADGSVETLPIYRIRLIWHGHERAIRACAASGDPLVGMALLSESGLLILGRV